MIVIPAIDLKEGRCVRLVQGDFGRATVYADDPAAMASVWKQRGAERLHVVDLDGSLAGVPRHEAVIREIVAETGLPVQVGGGIRTMKTVETYLRMRGPVGDSRHGRPQRSGICPGGLPRVSGSGDPGHRCGRGACRRPGMDGKDGGNRGGAGAPVCGGPARRPGLYGYCPGRHGNGRQRRGDGGAGRSGRDSGDRLRRRVRDPGYREARCPWRNRVSSV